MDAMGFDTQATTPRERFLKAESASCRALLCLLLDGEAEALRALDDPDAVARIVEEADAHLATGKEALALRLLREETGLRWDDLHQVVGAWRRMDAACKRDWLRISRLVEKRRRS